MPSSFPAKVFEVAAAPPIYAARVAEIAPSDWLRNPLRWRGEPGLPQTRTEGLHIEIGLRAGRLFGVDFEDVPENGS